jgi:PAS domain S-box-containing protein
VNKFRQLPIGTQVLLTFGTLSAILLIIDGLFFFSLRAIEHSNEEQQSHALNELALIDDTAQDVGQMQADILRKVLAPDAGEINRFDQTIHDLEKTNAKELADYKQFVDTEKERELYDRVMQARKAYWKQTQPLLALSQANRDAEAMESINSKQAPAYDDYLKAINTLIAYVETNARDTARATTRFISQIRTAGNALAAIAIIITLGTGFAVSGIGRRLKEDNRLLQVEVTERKRAEVTSRESEEKFRQLAETITDVFWMTSPDLLKIHYVSPAYEQIWGRSVESSYANPREWVEAILPEERERVFGAFLKLAQEPTVSVEFRIARPDGAVRWIFNRGFQVRDIAGKVIRFAGVASDITERKQAEESLRESEEKFRQLASNITDVFWMTSPDLKVIQYISPGYELIWGRSAESLYANPHQWVEAILPEQRERVFGIFGALTQSEPSVSVEYRIARPDGTIRWVHDRGFQVRDAAGNLVRLTGIVTDITERKQLESQLFQSQKMETVGKLAGGIAHEFNSILTAIIGRSELLLNDLPTGGPDFANAMAIRKAADLAASLTKQLLAYGRKQILRSETLNLNHVLSGMEGMLRHLVGSDVDVRVVTAAGLPAVKADAGQIEQVIMNVAINAREAMRHGGKLTLETSRTTLGEEYVHRYPELKAGNYVMLAISDTGEGMTEEVKSHLFEPFFTTKRVGEGTGLGLAMCHGIIKQSGGHINVYSELGRGTTFKIYLPLTELRTEIPAAKPSSPPLPRGTETILLVEDDTSLREMASLLLQRLGYAVLVAANGPEALNLTRQADAGRIDMLFTDIVMPQMDGKDLSDRVLALYPNTKVLFTSAYTETAIVHQGVLDPGVSLLQKPFTPTALALKVRELLDARP